MQDFSPTSTPPMPRFPAVCGSDLALRLQALLSERGSSPYQLSQATGMSERHLEDLVNGRVSRPRPATVVKLANAFGITSQQLLGIEEEGGVSARVLIRGDDADVLLAVGAVLRVPLEDVVREAVRRYAEQSLEDEAIRRVIDAVRAARGDVQEPE